MDKNNRKPPARRTKAEREQWVARWRESGKSVPEFAAEHGLASSSLYQWIRPPGTRSKKKGKSQRPPAKPAFAEVSVVGRSPTRKPAMTIGLRCGHSVTFEDGMVDPSWLASVLKVVSAC